MTDDEIIAEFSDYIRDTIDVYNRQFDGPVCPFALPALLNDEIEFVVTDNFSPNNMIKYISDWLKYDKQTQVLIIIYPYTEKMSCLFLDVLCGMLNNEFFGEAECFAGHPLSTHRVRGVLTRQDPFGNIQCNRATDLSRARDELRRTGYYASS